MVPIKKENKNHNISVCFFSLSRESIDLFLITWRKKNCFLEIEIKNIESNLIIIWLRKKKKKKKMWQYMGTRFFFVVKKMLLFFFFLVTSTCIKFKIQTQPSHSDQKQQHSLFEYYFPTMLSTVWNQLT